METANFSLPETHSEYQSAPLKTRRMRCSPSPHNNGALKIHAGIGGSWGGGGWLFHCGIRLFPNHLSSFQHGAVTNRTSECLAVRMARGSS